MLSPEALSSAWPLAERIDANNFVVRPIPGTPLDALVNATRAGNEFSTPEPDGSYTPDVITITRIANALDPRLGQPVCSHTETLNDVRKVVADALRGHISFARTVVAPAVEDLATRVAEELAAGSASELLGMEVTVDEPPELLTSANFASLIGKFAETPFDNPQMTFSLPDQSMDDLRDLFKTGSGSVDSDVESWMAEVGDTYLTEIFSVAFQCKQEGPDSLGAPGFRQLLTGINGRNNAIAIFLLANRLIEDPVEGTEMDNRLYQSLMADFRGQAAAHLSRLIDMLTLAEKHGALIISYTHNKVFVNGGVYRKWIENGGSNEILYGNLLSGQTKTSVEDINERAAKFQEDWNKYCLITAASETNRRFSRTREAFSNAFRAQMDDVDLSQEGVTNNVEMIIQKFERFLEGMKERDMACLYTMALRLVCASRFSHTDSEQILSGIEAYKKQNPSVPVDQVATIVYLNYISTWVGKQMTVSAI